MLTNLLDLENNLSVRDVHKEEKSSKRSKEQEESRKKKASRVKNFLFFSLFTSRLVISLSKRFE